jgi:hypothetical protein
MNSRLQRVVADSAVGPCGCGTNSSCITKCRRKTGVRRRYVTSAQFVSKLKGNRNSVFWEITSCSPLKVNWRFGGTYRPHCRSRGISQARNQREAGSEQSYPLADISGFFFGLFFDPEDGGGVFLRNVGWLYRTPRPYIPEDRLFTTAAVRTWNPTQGEDNLAVLGMYEHIKLSL